jgi:hypothetical protein
MTIFLHEYAYSIKTNVQRVKQQYIFETSGTVAKFRQQVVRLEGLILFSKYRKKKFSQKKEIRATTPLYEPKVKTRVYPRFEAEKIPLFGIH